VSPRRMLLGAVLAASTVCGIVANPAAAAPRALGGSPLNVFVDDRGQLQAFRADRAESPGIFYESSSQTGDAGFFLAFPTMTAGEDLQGQVYGFDTGAILGGMELYAPVSQQAPTGSGTAASPLTQVTEYAVRPNAVDRVSVEQTTTYVNGAQSFRIRWDVTNNTGASLAFKAIAAADFYFDGSDRGTGIYTQGPPQFIGGTNADTGNSGGFEEVLGAPSGSPGWTRYEALAYGSAADQVWGKVKAAAGSTGPTFANTVVGEQVDNAGAVEWDQNVATPLPNGQTRSFELTARSAVPAALQLSPTNAGAAQGVPINITATATNTEGVPYAGRVLRYAISGVNPGGGAVTLGSDGRGVITDPGTNAGADTVVAYVDFNNNGIREALEPQASALTTFVDNIAPTCTVKVTGDRPGGGGAGKPLVISVNCGEAATVTVATQLRGPAARSSAATAAQKKKKKRAKRIRLKPKTVALAPGQAVPVKLKLPRSVRRKYAGKTLRATVTVTATDATGNAKKVTVKRKIKLRKLKRKKG
jgi:hypothetical protein